MGTNNKVLVLIVAQLTALLGCANAPESSQPPSGKIIQLPVKILDFNAMEMAPGTRPKHLSLTLGPIPGSFGGNSRVDLDTPSIGEQTSIPLNLTRLAEKFAPLATPLTETGRSRLEVTPLEARFVRVATGVSFKSTQTIKMGIGFFDADTNDTLTLVYFDRPCHVRSAVAQAQNAPTENAVKAEVDIDVDTPGWVWVETIKTDTPANVRQIRAPSPHPVLLVAPADAYKKYREGAS